MLRTIAAVRSEDVNKYNPTDESGLSLPRGVSVAEVNHA